jgi:anti-sigma regulatory factor (Ser/Thr protein kinase)
VPTFSIDLPFDITTPKAARRALAERFGGRARCDDLLLCVSEVVSNAVLHARSAPTLTVRWEQGLLRVEVRDDDPHLPVRRYHETQAPTGRGLHLLDALTDDWGVIPVEGGKVVWFELDIDSEAA